MCLQLPLTRESNRTSVCLPLPPACCHSAPHPFLQAPFPHSLGGVSLLCPPKAPAPPFPTDARGKSLVGTQPRGERVLGFPQERIIGARRGLEQKQVYLAKRISKKSHSHTEWPTLLSREGREAPVVSRWFVVSWEIAGLRKEESGIMLG